jgi:hypothetical protein
MDPVTETTATLKNLVKPGIELGTSGSATKNTGHQTTEAVAIRTYYRNEHAVGLNERDRLLMVYNSTNKTYPGGQHSSLLPL